MYHNVITRWGNGQAPSFEAFITDTPSTSKIQGTAGMVLYNTTQCHPYLQATQERDPWEHSNVPSDLALQKPLHTSKQAHVAHIWLQTALHFRSRESTSRCHSPVSPLERLQRWVGNQTCWFTAPTKGSTTSWTCWCTQRAKNLHCANVGIPGATIKFDLSKSVF